MYIKRTIANCGARPTTDTRHITHYRHPEDDRLMVEYGHERYGFETCEDQKIAKVRDGLLNTPGNIADVPLVVLLYVKFQGYRILGAEVNSDILDTDESSPAEGYEIWI